MSLTVKSLYPSGSADLYLRDFVKKEIKRKRNWTTYDMVNGWLSKPFTACPLHDVSVVTIRTCGHETPKNGATSQRFKNQENNADNAPSSSDSAQYSPVTSNPQDEPSSPQGIIIGKLANEQIRSG